MTRARSIGGVPEPTKGRKLTQRETQELLEKLRRVIQRNLDYVVHVQDTVGKAPPLSREQRDRLRVLLN